MRLDPVLLEILVCPDCKGSLTADYEHEELICNRCGLIYPVQDDIPVMLVDEARRQEPEPTPASAAPSSEQSANRSAESAGSHVAAEAPDSAHPAPQAPVTDFGPANGRDD